MNDDDNIETAEEEEDISIADLPDFGTGIHVITLTYSNDPNEIPHLNLGDSSPWVAATLFRAALDSIDIMIPPMGITYKGDVIISHTIELDDDDEDD